jgi:two-component system nitrate/nitrite response regulator NarL
MDLKSKNASAANDLQTRASAPTGAGPGQRLTSRQNQIVAMLKIGSSNREIAQVLGLSEGTIKVHLHRIYQRMGVSNRTQLAAQSFTAQ